ncbi:PorT family protein [Flavobacterium sp. MAH-1]|uniref:PorT family protein n=1 Tax=Flavobacterium agri TaxID=2743471 RepID=A0A7Y8Y3Y8_9FLAO|nr:porin family protein [Flavobacterium agri]NUY82063.1 PorT family protein [Flavobacterium agri]NYA72087.1 PorT family protein [Flavobacterium agri]
MKTRIFLALMLFGSVMATQAQFLRFGIKAGPNFANFSGGVDGIDYKSRTSFHAGAVVQIKPFDNFALQPEVLYSSQGADVEGVGDFNLDYISVPVMARFFVLTDKLSIDVGPQFSFLVDDAEVVFDEVAGDADTESFDFAAAGGVTLNITQGLFVSGRYTIGLTEASKDAEVKNAVFQLSLGYMF